MPYCRKQYCKKFDLTINLFWLMKSLSIQKTDALPEVKFDVDTGIMHMEGMSYDEDALEFYKVLMQWLEQFSEDPSLNNSLKVNLFLHYLDSCSTKCMYEVLNLFKGIKEKVDELEINWYYEEDEEDMEDMGIEYGEILEMDINVLKVKSA